MSSAITTYGASYVLNVLFGQRQTPPPFYYVALLTQAPGEQADGTTLKEPDPNAGYARAQLLNDTFSWGQAVDGMVTSTASVLYPVATSDWTPVTHYALCDAQTGGNVYLYGSFTTPRKVTSGDQCRIPSQLLNVSVASLPTALVSTF